MQFKQVTKYRVPSTGIGRGEKPSMVLWGVGQATSGKKEPTPLYSLPVLYEQKTAQELAAELNRKLGLKKKDPRRFFCLELRMYFPAEQDKRSARRK